MEDKSSFIRLISGVFFLILFYLVVNNYSKGKEESSINRLYKSSIIGVVDSVFYDVKGVTYVVVNEEIYYLYNFAIAKRDNIMKGDSVYKKVNDRKLTFYRLKFQKIISSKSFESRGEITEY